MLRAVIFDFDGVITDSEILHYRAFNEILSQFGIELTTKDYYTTYLGLNDVDCFGLLIEQGRLKAEIEQVPALVGQKKVIFEVLAQSEGRIIEGVRDFLGMLEQNNVPMGICSGTLRTEIELILAEAKLRHLFSIIVSAEQVHKGKPDPEGFLLTLSKLNENGLQAIKGDECVVIEDSRWGLEAAKAAGMHAVAVTNTYEADQLGLADKIVSCLTELAIDDLQQVCK